MRLTKLAFISIYKRDQLRECLFNYLFRVNYNFGPCGNIEIWIGSPKRNNYMYSHRSFTFVMNLGPLRLASLTLTPLVWGYFGPLTFFKKYIFQIIFF